MYRFFQGLALVVRRTALSSGCLVSLALLLSLVPSCRESQAPKKKADTFLKFPIKIETQKTPTGPPKSHTVESFEPHATWEKLATTFMKRWTAGKSLDIPQEEPSWTPYRQIMPYLWKGTVPDWLDHKKVIQPKFGKYIHLLYSVVKEVEDVKDEQVPRYYLETRCRWKNATAMVRFTFKNNSKGQLVITGFWLDRDPDGPPLPAFRSNGYILGEAMMRLAGYSDYNQIQGWRNKAGTWWTAADWGSNYLIPVHVKIADPQNSNQNWQVKWWYDPKTTPLTSKGQSVIIDGKRWVRYNDPPGRWKLKRPFESIPGNYRLSLEIPREQLIPKDPQGETLEDTKPIAHSFTAFSDVISIDKSTSALDIEITVPDQIEDKRREMLSKVVEKSEQFEQTAQTQKHSQKED